MADFPIRILGIDPGLRCMGWGMIALDGSRLSALAHGVIKPPTDAPLAMRLSHIFDAVTELVREHAPHEAAIEEAFMAKNAMSALKLGHARAAAMLAPCQAGLPVAEYAARLVKKSVVGTGTADKHQIAAMIGVLLPGTKAKADAADALAIAICHANHRSIRRMEKLA
jgi:crossover junction endodeoxyribonuclease RuvC